MALRRTAKRYRVSYEVWVQLIESLNDDARRIVADVDHSRKLLGKILGRKADLILGLDRSYSTYSLQGRIGRLARELTHSPTAAVDSSSTPPIRLVSYLYSAVSSATVIYYRGIDGEPEFHVFAHGIRAPDRADPSYAKVELRLGMFEAELKALKVAIGSLLRYCERERCRGPPVLLLDGPIVDPPRFLPTAKRAGEELVEKYRSYVAERAKEILRLIKAGGIAIGYVKRIYGTMFVRALAERDDDIKGFFETWFTSDFAFVSMCRDIIAKELCRNGGDYTIVFKEFDLPSDMVDIDLYRQHDLDVISFYVIPRLCGNTADSRPVRVEVALPRSEASSEGVVLRRIEDAASIIAGWLVPATGVPEPVVLAHRRCTIRRREARKILRELATRFVEREASRQDPVRAARIARTLIE